MKNNEESVNFTDLLEELADEELLEEIQSDERYPDVTDENVNEFILEYGSRLVKDGMDAIDRVKPKITSGQDADEISALSELMRAMNSTLGTLTKISLQNKKEKSEKANKELEYVHKKELGPSTTNNTVIVGTREDIFKQLRGECAEVIDVEGKEIKNEED